MTTGVPKRVRRALGEVLETVRSFYRRPIAWIALLVSSVLLTFGGGAVMFWFHAVFRGEKGPAIDDLHHWLLDATLGFVALTPVLALILPFGVLAAGGGGRSRTRAYVATVATLFTLTTGPGPFLHNLVAGHGTPLARWATDLFGHDHAIAARNMHALDRSALTEGTLQILLGLPVYVLCTWLALVLVRGSIRGSRRLRGAGPVGGTRPAAVALVPLPTLPAADAGRREATSA